MFDFVRFCSMFKIRARSESAAHRLTISISRRNDTCLLASLVRLQCLTVRRPPFPASVMTTIMGVRSPPQDPYRTTTSSAIINSIDYEFEDYAMNYGIPKIVDPLPFRKQPSLFDSKEGQGTLVQSSSPTSSSQILLTIAKHDPRLRTVVCRHWLRDLCMKGSACEFLHQYDLSKMPLCATKNNNSYKRHCKILDCPMKHVRNEDQKECTFYAIGFCVHGPTCKYQHVRRQPEDLPLVADFTAGLPGASLYKIMAAGKTTFQQLEGIAASTLSNNTSNVRRSSYKTSLCKHYLETKICPYGNDCLFAHGQGELRRSQKRVLLYPSDGR